MYILPAGRPRLSETQRHASTPSVQVVTLRGIAEQLAAPGGVATIRHLLAKLSSRWPARMGHGKSNPALHGLSQSQSTTSKGDPNPHDTYPHFELNRASSASGWRGPPKRFRFPSENQTPIPWRTCSAIPIPMTSLSL